MTNKIYYTLVVFLLAATSLLHAQDYLTGRVYELTGNDRIVFPGVNVMVVNEQNRLVNGTTTNQNGEYSIRIPQVTGKLKIEFSFIGMKTQRFDYTGQKTLEVTLEEEALLLAEMVIARERIEKNELGITTREQTFASQSIKMEDFIESLPEIGRASCRERV